MPATSKRFHIILDEAFRKMVEFGAHESWMSVGQYIRDCTALFKGCHYDEAADMVRIGKEIGREGFEALLLAADRKKMTLKEYCNSLGKQKNDDDSSEKKSVDAAQLSLF